MRTYYNKNILAFGDLLHRLHHLAGQGFNMTIRDIRDLSKLIEFKFNNGLELDNLICEDFQNITKHKNYLFSSGIDFIYEFFNFESKMKNNIISKSVKLIGKNKFSILKTYPVIVNFSAPDRVTNKFLRQQIAKIYFLRGKSFVVKNMIITLLKI